MNRIHDIKSGKVKHRPQKEQDVAQLNVYSFDYEAHTEDGQRIPGSLKVAAQDQDAARSAVLEHAMEAHDAKAVHLKHGGTTLLNGIDLVEGDSAKAGILRRAAELAHSEVEHLRKLVAELEAKVKALEEELAAKVKGQEPAPQQ